MLRLLAVLFLALGAGFLGYDVFRLLTTGGWRPLAFGELWSMLHPTSLQLLQPAIERHLSPALWDPVLAVLLLPAFVDMTALGLIFAGLALAFRPRRRRTLLD